MSASSSWLATTALRRTSRLAPSLLVVLVLLFFTAIPAAKAHASGTSVSALSPAEVEQLLSGIPLKDLSAEQLGAVLSERLSSSPSSGLKEALTKAIDGLSTKGGTLGQLAGSSELASALEKQLKELPLGEKLSLEGLLGLLDDHTLSSVLGEKLGTLEGRQVVGELLKTASEPGQSLGPEQLIEKLLTTPSPEKLEQLLGSTLTGERFTDSTVEGLADQAGTTTGALDADFDATSSQLPASAMALSAPLTDGKTLGVLDAVEGIDVGTLTHELAGGTGGSGGAGGPGSGSSGGTGGSGGSGGSAGTASGTPADMTIVNELLNPSVASPAAISSAKAAAEAKVKIVSHTAKSDALTLVVQVPAAGRLAVKGDGVRTVAEQTDKAERLSIRVPLTKADAASVRKHHRRELELTVSFAPVAGASSTARADVVLG